LTSHLQSSDTIQSDELTPGLSEFDLKYYGWRVVLAACFGVMAGFGSLFVYTFAVFVKPLSAEFGWVCAPRCWAGGSTVLALAASFFPA
jgi:hypothetical protein